MLDANQSLSKWSTCTAIKPYSIEWLWLQSRLVDPFITLFSKNSNSTTQTPNRDIYCVLTFGIDVQNISTMAVTYPNHSDHLGFVFDLDLASCFSSNQTSNVTLLTFSVTDHLKLVSMHIRDHKMVECTCDLYNIAINDLSSFSSLLTGKLDKRFGFNQLLIWMWF